MCVKHHACKKQLSRTDSCWFLLLLLSVQTLGTGGSSSNGNSTTVVATSAVQVPCRWHASMQKAFVPTKDELVNYRSVYEQILYVDIPAYYKGRAGRYLQVDTARVFQFGNILTDLFYGKTPDARTYLMMVSGNYRTKTGADKAALEAWMNETYPDIRKKGKRKDTQRQTSILEFAIHTGNQYGRGAGAKSGRCVLYMHACFNSNISPFLCISTFLCLCLCSVFLYSNHHHYDPDHHHYYDHHYPPARTRTRTHTQAGS